ncbi:feline leukemia virus subgroup C receptor-related protein 1-like isoform X3 [Hydractinia symbiolongicarpus]|uniref:feline leukemia virus subgroup C receptor-related protein 1-like isoform X3 n=1 Tax=Hydractinia symbiolongicarpus TaxID=13093 RepID=UPI002550E45F|nr:feline leukemia virus subgroup C receptor-related protein 1-like isoform X3 [Hydractinia symbiolongicarpus]
MTFQWQLLAIYQSICLLLVTCECCWGFATGIMYQLATDVSEVWFPAHQHALATNINMSMMNVGFGISYLQTMVLFNNSKSMSNADLQNHLNILIYSQSVPCLLVFVLIMFFYRESPKYPPSISQARRTGPGNISFLETIDSIKILGKDYRFVIFAFIFGFNGAFGVTYPVIANLLITPSYNNSDKLVSVMGILAVAIGFVGCVLFSMILDKTKKFKTILMLLLIVSSALFTMFSEFLIHIYPVYVIYLISTLAWFFFTPTTGVLADIISEITYPINNSTSLAFCSVISGLFTAIVTQISGWLSDKRKVGILDYMLCGILGIQILLLIGVPVVKKRSLSDSDGVISSSVEAT